MPSLSQSLTRRRFLATSAALALLFAGSGLPAEQAPVSILAARIGGHIHPSICRTKDGTLVVVYKGANVLMCARSTDSGMSWSQPEPIATSARRPDVIREVKTFEVYPGTADTLPDDRILVTWNYIADDKANDGYYERALLYTVSSDQGRSWSEQKLIGPINDKHLGAVRHNVLPWSDGRWLLPLRVGPPRLFDPRRGTLTEFPLIGPDGKQHEFQQIVRTAKGSLLAMGPVLLHSPDDGRHWASIDGFPAIPDPRDNAEGRYLTTLSDGRVLVTWGIGSDNKGLRYNMASDDGRSWNAERTVVLLPETSIAARYYSARTIQLDEQHVGTVFMNRDGVHFLKVSLARLGEAHRGTEDVQSSAFPGQPSDWHGFKRFDYEVEGKPVLVVAPEQPAAGRPWVWHGEFFGHKPEPDIALLKRGFHVVYMRVPDMLGAPQAVLHWNAFYRELTEKYGLAKKVALVGLSRGGLYCYNWATANPDKVACIYGDAPVCDFKSWPGGKGKGKGSPRDWKLVLERYQFKDEAEALAYNKNPIDNLAPLAAAKVPLLHVYGDADEVVPWNENTGVIAERYRKLGGSVTLIAKPGIGHHPHGLDDPMPIVEFLAEHTVGQQVSTKPRSLDPVAEIAAQLEPTQRLVYKKAGGRELYLHVFEPDGLKQGDRRPCFLVFHGGGWTGGEPRRMYPFAEHFARLGMVGISVQYRLLNTRQGTTVFDCVKDGRSAVRFVRSHAESLGIDPEQIIVSGGSAGGHVAAGTALFEGVDEAGESTGPSSVPAALVLLYPVIDTSQAGYGNAKIGDRWQDLSPAHQVRGKAPPTLVFHGTGDTVTPFAGAEAFREAMQKSGNRCDLVAHPDGKHGYLMFDRQLYLETLAKTGEFLVSLKLLPRPKR